MTRSPSPLPSPDERPAPAVPTSDPAPWRRHLPALSAAAAGIQQASDDWDAVSVSLCDVDGWPLDQQEYANGTVKRDAEAWKHAEVFLDHGPEVLAGVRSAASGPDYVQGPVSDDLRRLRGIDTVLERASQLQNEWDQIMALMEASQPGSLQLYQQRAEEHRNAEGWHYADELSYQGPALVRAAEYLADREAEQPTPTERARVALTRTTPDAPGLPPVPPVVPPPARPPAPGRSR
ncbi:hypothetical protein ACFV13_21635 [Streptomyces bauhiniae]|uniref:hypothetical protein n=1 Tax=Streptomyces bauhiniae TaxID=2340725 RepID=UPI0036A9F67A